MNISMTIILALLFSLVVICLTLVMIIAIKKVNPDHSKSLRLLFEQTHFLKLATVLVVIISATFLQVEGKLDDGIIGILSGLVGYVLGGLNLNKESAIQDK